MGTIKHIAKLIHSGINLAKEKINTTFIGRLFSKANRALEAFAGIMMYGDKWKGFEGYESI